VKRDKCCITERVDQNSRGVVVRNKVETIERNYCFNYEENIPRDYLGHVQMKMNAEHYYYYHHLGLITVLPNPPYLGLSCFGSA
jgi:hypothetical protein